MLTIRFTTKESLLWILQSTVEQSNREQNSIDWPYTWQEWSQFALLDERGNLVKSFESLDTAQMPFRFKISDMLWNDENEGLIQACGPSLFKLTFNGLDRGQEPRPKYTLVGGNEGPTRVMYEGDFGSFVSQKLVLDIAYPDETEAQVDMEGKTLTLQQYKAHIWGR